MVDVAVRVLITVWLVAVSVRDARQGIILNRMTAPVFLGVGLFQLGYSAIVLRTTTPLPGEAVWWWRPVFILASFAVCFALWMLHFIGGGRGSGWILARPGVPTGSHPVTLASSKPDRAQRAGPTKRRPVGSVSSEDARGGP